MFHFYNGEEKKSLHSYIFDKLIIYVLPWRCLGRDVKFFSWYEAYKDPPLIKTKFPMENLRPNFYGKFRGSEDGDREVIHSPAPPCGHFYVWGTKLVIVVNGL